jgi:hypothetical protein
VEQAKKTTEHINNKDLNDRKDLTDWTILQSMGKLQKTLMMPSL